MSRSPFTEVCTLAMLETSSRAIASSPGDLFALVPRHNEPSELLHQEVEHETQRANQHHSQQNVVAAKQCPGVVDQIAKSARRRHEFAGDQRHPAKTERDPQAGE